MLCLLPTVDEGMADSESASSPHLTGVDIAQAFHCSVKLDDVATVTQLLEKGADLNARDSTDPVHRTPLMLAAEYNNSEVAETLVKHHADQNMIDGDGNTAVILAVESDCPEVLEVLVAHGGPVEVCFCCRF